MQSTKHVRRAIASLATFAALGLGAVGAQAVTVSPVLVALSPTHRIVSITISNPGSTALTYQTQALAWTQVDGSDRFADSDALLVTPAIATIPAGGVQIFRVAARLPPATDEQAYRLVFEDISVLATPLDRQLAVSVRVNHNLPVFIAAAGDAKALPTVGACDRPADAGKGCLRIANQGDRYLQVSGLSIGDGAQRQSIALSGRVLAGAWKQFEYTLPAHAASATHLEVASSAGPLVLGAPGVH